MNVKENNYQYKWIRFKRINKKKREIEEMMNKFIQNK